MHWRDEGIILHIVKQGEQSAVVGILTRTQGRHSGLLKGAFGKGKSLCMPGNLVDAQWNARLSEHLGMWKMEIISPIAALVLHDGPRLNLLQEVCQLLHRSLPEREPHPGLYERLLQWQHLLLNPAMTLLQLHAGVAMLEAFLLQDMGFGLDVEACAVTGETSGLTYISPKTGRAVSAEAGAAYKEKLLPFSRLLRTRPEALHEDIRLQSVTEADIFEARQVTGFFLQRIRAEYTSVR